MYSIQGGGVLGYLCLHQENLSNQDKMLNNTRLDAFPGIVIPDVLTNIIPYQGCPKEQQFIIILL